MAGSGASLPEPRPATVKDQISGGRVREERRDELARDRFDVGLGTVGEHGRQGPVA
jgi:hypothetical protein